MKINGQELDLSHLPDPLVREVEMRLPGGIKKKARVNFHFSCHCYSRSPNLLASGGVEEIPPELFVFDGSPVKPRPRIFCPDRYQLSKQLVGCIDTMIESDGTLTRTQHVNYFHLSGLQHAVVGLPNPANYFVFMNIRIVKPANHLPRQFKIMIESAYVNANANGAKSATFSETLGLHWAGQG